MGVLSPSGGRVMSKSLELEADSLGQEAGTPAWGRAWAGCQRGSDSVTHSPNGFKFRDRKDMCISEVGGPQQRQKT